MYRILLHWFVLYLRCKNYWSRYEVHNRWCLRFHQKHWGFVRFSDTGETETIDPIKMPWIVGSLNYCSKCHTWRLKSGG